MDMVFEELSKIGIVPVVVIDNADDAVPLAQALVEGGLPAAEITFRTPAAKESIRRIRDAFPQMTVGAGTVLTTQQAEDAAAAGARFIVSPGFDEQVVEHCREIGIPVLPGCATATDIQKALKIGLGEVKIFPAQQLGGLDMIRALGAPYPNVRFMPTGGLNEKNIGAYLEEPKVFCCGGSFMVSKKLISCGDFDGIRELTRRAVSLMLRLTFAAYEDNGCEQRLIMQSADLGRTVYHMMAKGVKFDDDSAVRREGRLISIDCENGMRLIQKQEA